MKHTTRGAGGAAGKSRNTLIFSAAVILFIVIAAFLLTTTAASAYTGSTKDGYTVTKDYQKTKNVPTLTGYSGTDTELTLPTKVTISEYSGEKEYDITAIDAFLDNVKKSKVTSITIPEGYTMINSGAFKECTALETVKIPASMTSIGSNAFAGCTSLKNITFAAGTQKLSINNGAFTNCTSLESVELPARITADTNGTNFFYGCTSLKEICIAEGNDDYITSDDGALFLKNKDDSGGVTGLTLVTWPESRLTADFTIPESVESYKVTGIGAHAFRNNQVLTKLTVPETVITFRQYCLNGCSNLKQVKLLVKDPDSFTYETIDAESFTDMASESVIYVTSEEIKEKLENLTKEDYETTYGYYDSSWMDEQNRFTPSKTTVEVIRVSTPGDLNEDGNVDLLDITEAQKYYRASKTDARWNEAKKADMNNDGAVDIDDLTAIYKLAYQ